MNVAQPCVSLHRRIIPPTPGDGGGGRDEDVNYIQYFKVSICLSTPWGGMEGGMCWEGLGIRGKDKANGCLEILNSLEHSQSDRPEERG